MHVCIRNLTFSTFSVITVNLLLFMHDIIEYQSNIGYFRMSCPIVLSRLPITLLNNFVGLHGVNSRFDLCLTTTNCMKNIVRYE